MIKRTPFLSSRKGIHEAKGTSSRRGPTLPLLFTNVPRILFRPLSALSGRRCTIESHINTQPLVHHRLRHGTSALASASHTPSGQGGGMERERPADRSSCVEPMPSVEANARQRCDIYLEAVGSFHGCCCWDKARRTISACDAVQRVHVFWRSRWFPPRRSSTFPNPDPRNKKMQRTRSWTSDSRSASHTARSSGHLEMHHKGRQRRKELQPSYIATAGQQSHLSRGR